MSHSVNKSVFILRFSSRQTGVNLIQIIQLLKVLKLQKFSEWGVIFCAADYLCLRLEYKVSS